MVKYLICLIIPFLFAFQANKKHYFKTFNEINYDGIYVSRDTFFSIDKNFKNEITISLLKFSKSNNTVQASIEYSYKQGEDDKLNNIAIQKCLNNFSSYYFTIKNSNLNINCNFKYPKKQAIDFATPRSSNVNQNFTINGNQLIRKGKSNKLFKKIYVLDKSLIFNFSKIRHRNACESNASY